MNGDVVFLLLGLAAVTCLIALFLFLLGRGSRSRRSKLPGED